MPTIAPGRLREVADGVQPSILRGKGYNPVPQRVSLIEGIDSEGKNAYFVYLAFADSTPDSDFSWDKIKDMVAWVRDFVWEQTGQETPPYIRVKKEADLPPGL